MNEEERRKRIATNESLFRTVNEKIEDISLTFGAVTESMSVVCECGDLQCAEQLEVGLSDYEQVRSDPTWFVVAPGHEISDVEEIVAHHDGFDVVCKRKGGGEAVAIATDPRS
jgi:hypothetical protein